MGQLKRAQSMFICFQALQETEKILQMYKILSIYYIAATKDLLYFETTHGA
jgi:hypothetical protein